MIEKEIPISQLVEPERPARTEMNDQALEELATSIKAVGLLQNLLVKPADGDLYEVIAGHRRLKALRIAGVAAARCYIVEGDVSDEAIKIHENVDREDLNPADEAAFYLELFETHKDTRKVAELVRKPLDYVERRMNLLYNADREVFESLRSGVISIGVAEELNKMELETDRTYHLHFARRGGATVRQMRDYRIQANERAKLAALTPAAPAAGSDASTPAEPAASDEAKFLHHAKPWQLSSELTPRPCLFCGETHPEHKMFKVCVCGTCSDKHLLPLEQK